MDFMYKLLRFPCVLLLVFHHDCIIYIDFTHIAASNTATDDVTHQVIHRVFNTNIQYSCVHFITKIGEKSSLVDAFKYDLMMILGSGLVFWGHLVYTYRQHSRL